MKYANFLRKKRFFYIIICTREEKFIPLHPNYNRKIIMKFNHLVFTLLSAAALLVACTEDPYMPSPGDNTHNQDSIYVAPDTPIPDSIKDLLPAEAINVHEAVKIGKALGNGGTTKEKYYVYGWVTSLDGKHASGMTQYGNGTFYIAANKDGLQKEQFEAYQVYGRGGKMFDKVNQLDAVAIGDFVVIYGLITNYNGTVIETTGKGAAYVWFSTNPLW